MSRLTKIFLYAVYTVCVVGLGIIIAMSFRSERVAPPAVPIGKSSHQKSSPATKPTTKVATPSQSKPTSSAANQTTQTNSGSTSQLTNTGPGDLSGLFIVVSLSAAMVYRRFTILKLSHRSTELGAASRSSSM
jgi:hypothetical protein